MSMPFTHSYSPIGPYYSNGYYVIWLLLQLAQQQPEFLGEENKIKSVNRWIELISTGFSDRKFKRNFTQKII